MSSATVRVVCASCGSKLDIRVELAGNKRRCPKCKTEFVVPEPEDDNDGVSLVEDGPDETTALAPSSLQPPKPKPSLTPAVPPKATPPVMASLGDDDEDDDDYIPSFVTTTAKDDRKTPPPPPASSSDDDEPVLSIPNIPPPSKPKIKPFIPEEFDDDKHEEPIRKPVTRSTPAPAGRDKAARRNRLSDEFDLDEPSPPPPTRSPGRSPGLSDSSIPATSPTRDRAAAARELRQALKDSSLREPQEQQGRGGFSIDLSGLWSEIGIKGLALIVGLVLLLPALYYASNSMMGSGAKLPPLGYVTGVVTYDGKPVANAQVNFMPVPPQGKENEAERYQKIRTSVGYSDAKGEYKLVYMEGIAGVAVGPCRVWLELPPTMATPEEFSAMGRTMREVKSGNQSFDFSMTAPPNQKRR